LPAGRFCGRCWHGAGRGTLRRRLQNKIKNTGADVNSISYLPAAFTTLFFLAASLLLGYIL